mmetsp:Transcript_18488/g.27897  ORF Transcript_18488/g.27897 Transcript_18488/m.27897 type:complete len:111 (+) Transcript_18488:333-665(+)
MLHVQKSVWQVAWPISQVVLRTTFASSFVDILQSGCETAPAQGLPSLQSALPPGLTDILLGTFEPLPKHERRWKKRIDLDVDEQRRKHLEQGSQQEAICVVDVNLQKKWL